MSPQHSSSHLVKGFDKVVISAAAKCTCGKSIRPHDARHNDDVIEIICSGCHGTFLALELLETP